MKSPGFFRQQAKRIPGVRTLAGLTRYAIFSRRLRKADIEYQRCGNPRMPPPMLRYRVHRALDEASYDRNGTYLSGLLARHIVAQVHGDDPIRVLDFACGPGRVIAKLKGLLPHSEIHGSDIDGEAIAWASRNLGHLATFATNDFVPPTGYPDASFDLVYSVSLFTHLDEALQHVWLQELIRVLVPGGILIATTHGACCTPVCTADELAQLNQKGIVFRMDQRGKFKLDGLPDFYQTTFHTKAYVQREWSRYGDIEALVEGGVDNHQDLVILRKRATPVDPVEGGFTTAAAASSGPVEEAL